jgi:hypothetical protein
MAITQAIANSFKKQLLEGDHNFKQSGGDVFKLALYTAGATLTSATTSYTTSNEVAASGQYTAGGGALVNAGTSITAGVARVDFNNLSFTGVTLTARGALIYKYICSCIKFSCSGIRFWIRQNCYFWYFHNSIPSANINSSDSKDLWLILGGKLLWQDLVIIHSVISSGAFGDENVNVTNPMIHLGKRFLWKFSLGRRWKP